jgi:hypothetical protein
MSANLGKSGWKSIQGSDLLGTLVRSRNIDLSEPGYVKLAKKPCCIFNNVGVAGTGDVDVGTPVAMAADDNYYYLMTPTKFQGATISETALTFADLPTSGMPDVVVTSDMVVYNGAIAASGTTTLDYYSGFDGTANSGTWTNASDFSLGTNPHPLAVILSRNTLAIGDANKVYQTDTGAWTDDDTNILTIPSAYVVTSMRFRNNKLYVGTRSTNGANAMLFVWNGSGTSAEAAWPVDAQWIYSVCEYENSVAVLTSAGQLLYFSGAGFQELANFPVYYTSHSWMQNATGNVTRGKAVNRSMWAIGKTIYINIEGEARGNADRQDYLQPGGLWIYDPSVGLYHRAGFVSEPYRILAISSLASSIFTFGSNHGCETGDAVWAHTVSNIAALTQGRVYYAIKESATAFKLALSPADALAGRHITCTGTISGDKLAVETLDALSGVGQLIPGPVHGFTRLMPNQFFGEEVFFSGTLYGPTMSSGQHSIMSLGMGRNVGSFITPKIYGQGAKDFFQKLFLNIRGLNLDTDKVVVKYRTSERFGLPTPIRISGSGLTWVDGTSFTINTATKDVKSIQVGDEVDFTQGAATGYTAHIATIDDSTSTWTITLDETIPEVAASDASDFIVDNWKKLATITNASRDIDKGFFEQPLGEGASAWVQFKIELRGVGVAINMMDVINGVQKAKV